MEEKDRRNVKAKILAKKILSGCRKDAKVDVYKTKN